ncbi:MULTISPECIES: YqgQ family protein [Sporosarcina]|uniref:YqgQ family protein n=1 Tax=Sporosarcina contaminans TaxID=633403 RepID=A0ABW3TTE6_9BACL
MKDFFSVLQLLKRFGTFIYTGDRRTDIELMIAELKDLYDNGLIMKEDYLTGMVILKKELSEVQ